MSNWHQVPEMDVTVTADHVIVCPGGSKAVEVDIRGADVEQLVKSAGVDNVLHGIGKERIKQYLEGLED